MGRDLFHSAVLSEYEPPGLQRASCEWDNSTGLTGWTGYNGNHPTILFILSETSAWIFTVGF